MNNINVCASANSKYMRYLYVMLVSLFENNRSEHIDVYILQRDFSDKDKETLKELSSNYGNTLYCLDIDESKYAILPTTNRYSMETYFRFEIPNLLPKEIDRVIYLDVDIIVNSSISELYAEDIEGYYFAACTDMMEPDLIPQKQKLFGRYSDLRYFNAGVMLWNLKEIRGNVKFEDFLAAGKELGFELPCVDQDILNYLYYNKTKYLNPHAYNYLLLYDLDHVSSCMDAKIIHLNWFAPWKSGPKGEGYKLWWKYAKLSPFYEELLEEQLFRMEEYAYSSYNSSRKSRLPSETMSNIFQMLYKLKGTGGLKKALENCENVIFLYGAGKMAEAIYELFRTESCDDRIIGIFDGAKKGDFHGITIESFENSYSKCENSTVIVTPVNETQSIIDNIKMKVENSTILSLEEYLKSLI